MLLTLPHSTDAVSDAQVLGRPAGGRPAEFRLPTVTVTAGQALRLNSGQIEFGDPPPLADLPEVSDQLAFLRAYFQHQCGVWNKHARMFVACYFAFIEAEVAEARNAIERRLARFGSLYRPEQYAFSACRPLPRVHFPAPETPDQPLPAALVRAEIGFWGEDGGIAIDLVGSNTRGRAEALWRERLEASGIRVVEVPHAALRPDDPTALADLLPPDMHDFWRTDALPAGPFRTGSTLPPLPA